MVASDHALASQAGLEMLRAGGNAVDAAIAVSLALAVTRPESTGLGGGGFMIVRRADGALTALDYRERAPASATPDMFTRARAADPRAPAPSQFGHLAVAVPGQFAGLAEAHRRWGTLRWRALAAPAVRLAQRGFAVDDHYVEATHSVLGRFDKHPRLRGECAYVYRVHLREGRLRSVGETLRQPELARTMRALQAEGPESFVRESLAPELAAVMADNGGLITAQDVTNYTVTDRAPLRGSYRGHEIITMPPPSSGGVCLLEALNILENLPLSQAHGEDKVLAAHYVVEAMKHAFADRARWLGDPDFAPVPTQLLTSRAYAEVLALAIDAERTRASETYGSVQIPDDAGTSHFCVVDRWGNCVVSTETINTSFGSLTAVEKLGIILNNEMDDFTAEPGRANFFGLVQSPRNQVDGGKRPLSSMSPTMVLRDGQPVLLLGASGGPRIISAVLNVLVAVIDAGLPLAEAMTALRLHHQWQPDEVRFSSPPSPELRAGLTRLGHTLSSAPQTGVVQAIQAIKQGWMGASDPRKGGRPAGE